MSDRPHGEPHQEEEEDDAMLDADEADEVLEQGDDAAMDSGDEDEEILLQNDSAAHFDHHKSSIFCIAQHPTQPDLVATGGGDDIGYVWDCTPPEKPVLPASYQSDPTPREREGQTVIAALGNQDESVNAITFTRPNGKYIVTGTLAGTLNVYATPTSPQANARLVGSAKEVDEINWIAACPGTNPSDTIAFGANDGSVWVYTIDETADPASPLVIVQSFFSHQSPCTAGAWTPDGKLLATVAEDGGLFVWDVFGAAAAAGVGDAASGQQAVFGLTAEDERFRVDGGLYSVAVSPGGGIVAVGGAEGHIRIVGLPRLAAAAAAASKGGKAANASAGQSGQILASLQAQSDGVETLDFSQPPLTLLAAGSVDGSIALFDAAHNFAVRRHIPSAHEEEAVIQVAFVKTPLGTANPKGHLLTSCGNDGVVRRWDVRGGNTAAPGATAVGPKGLVGEWRGHRGGGDGGGILGFVQGGGGARIVTAGDDSVALVFEAN